MEIRLGKAEDHVDEVDDYLRGSGTGRKSLDTRIELMESELSAQGVMLRKISEQFGTLMGTSNTQLQEIKDELAGLKIQRAIAEGVSTIKEEVSEKADASRTERFKEWMKLWGALGIAVIALIVPLATLVVQNWDRIKPHPTLSVRDNVKAWAEEIERRKKDPETKKMLKERYGLDD